MGSQTGHEKASPDVLASLGYTPTARVSEPWTVYKVLETLPPHERPIQGTASPLAFFHMLERLKTTKREGWRRFDIYHGESIADHMYRMSVMVMLAPPSLAPKLDIPKCIKMCLLHDMAELLVGDITPPERVPKAEKSRRETDTMEFLTSGLLGGVDGGVVGAEMRAIWQEYEDRKTLESHFVHDVDKLELFMQKLEYEKRGNGAVNLSDFDHVADDIMLPEMRAWVAETLAENKAFWDSAKPTLAGNGINMTDEEKKTDSIG